MLTYLIGAIGWLLCPNNETNIRIMDNAVKIKVVIATTTALRVLYLKKYIVLHFCNFFNN